MSGFSVRDAAQSKGEGTPLKPTRLSMTPEPGLKVSLSTELRGIRVLLTGSPLWACMACQVIACTAWWRCWPQECFSALRGCLGCSHLGPAGLDERCRDWPGTPCLRGLLQTGSP